VTLAPLAPQPLLSQCLEHAASFLAAATPASVLRALLAPAASVQVAARVTALDHVGFLAPSSAAALLPQEAAAAGFGQGHRSFPSTVVASERGALLGTPAVPTTVFRAWGWSRAGRAMTVEAFTVDGLPDDIESAWIRAGVATHVALSVAGADDLDEVSAVMVRERWEAPAGVSDGPAWNPDQGLALAYFDRPGAERVVRLEYCALSRPR